MDYQRDSVFPGGNVAQVIAGNSGNGVGGGNWGRGTNDPGMWATEDDYKVWSREASVDTSSNFDVRLSQPASNGEPPLKKSRSSQMEEAAAMSRSKAIGKMFYKTKLCCKFRAGTCPYVTNCNFAHSIEELRKPPPNWQEIVAAHEEDRAVSMEPREEFQIPSLVGGVESSRSYKGRHCKKFYTEEGCPYGDNCTFLHDEQSKSRESEAISLGPGSGGGYNISPTAVPNLKPSNWKTRICNKWEMTGYCPFGTKCHFAHGAEELHNFGGVLGESDLATTPTDAKLGVLASKSAADVVVGAMGALPHSDGYHAGVPQKLSNVIQRTGQRPHLKWKGPDKISKIYGDWIDDLE